MCDRAVDMALLALRAVAALELGDEVAPAPQESRVVDRRLGFAETAGTSAQSGSSGAW